MFWQIVETMGSALALIIVLAVVIFRLHEMNGALPETPWVALFALGITFASSFIFGGERAIHHWDAWMGEEIYV